MFIDHSKELTIPEVREILAWIASNTIFTPRADLHYLITQLRRVPSSRPRTVTKSNRVTPEVRDQILDFGRMYPRESHQDIGNRVNVNNARVSEVLNGRRGKYGVPSAHLRPKGVLWAED